MLREIKAHSFDEKHSAIIDLKVWKHTEKRFGGGERDYKIHPCILPFGLSSLRSEIQNRSQRSCRTWVLESDSLHRINKKSSF